jgi:hypothetical protein
LIQAGTQEVPLSASSTASRVRQPARGILLWAALACVPSFAAPAAAQFVPPTVTFEHEGSDVTGFALYARPERGQLLRVDLGPLPATGNGVRSFRLPDLPPGEYELSLAAYNALGESPRSPTEPRRVRIEAVKPPAARKRAADPRSGSPAIATGDTRADGPPPPISRLPPAVAGTGSAAPANAAPVNEPAEKRGGFRRLWRVIVGD